MLFLSVSGGEILVVLFFILIFFGAKSIPDIARVFGKAMKEVNKATSEIKKEFEDSTNDIRRDLDKVKHSIENETDNRIKP